MHFPVWICESLLFCIPELFLVAGGVCTVYVRDSPTQLAKAKGHWFLSAMIALQYVHLHAVSVCVRVCVCVRKGYTCPLGSNDKPHPGESDGYIVLLVCLVDIQIVWRYPEAAAEKCNLSHCARPGYKVDYEDGGVWQRERQRERERGCLWVELSKGPLERKVFEYFFLPYLTTPVFSRLLSCRNMQGSSFRHSRRNILQTWAECMVQCGIKQSNKRAYVVVNQLAVI